MAQHVADLIQTELVRNGYWTLLVILLLENIGRPLPSETILLLASFMAATHRGLYLPYVIGIAIFVSALGDNLGYAIGVDGGRSLLDRYGRLFHITT